MSLKDKLNGDAIAGKIRKMMAQRMAKTGWPAEKIEPYSNLMGEFAKIATNLIIQESENPAATLQFNGKSAKTLLKLFSDGVYVAANRCVKINLNDELSSVFLQHTALQIYERGKQLVSGNDPSGLNLDSDYKELLLPVKETVKVVLKECIKQYEAQNGPLPKGGNSGGPAQ